MTTEHRTREMVFRRIFSTILVFFCLSLLSAGEAMETREFVRRRNFVLNDRIVWQSVTASSAAQCVGLCEQTAQCKSASWGSEDHVCKLSNTMTWSIKYDQVSVSPIYHTYTGILWRVWTVRGPRGRYTMSYSEAADECAKTDGRLATEADLLAERAIGYENCACGWLAEGTIGFVIQSYRPSCWGSFDTGIIYCNSADTSDAICTFDT